jgi:hypothetical protein
MFNATRPKNKQVASSDYYLATAMQLIDSVKTEDNKVKEADGFMQLSSDEEEQVEEEQVEEKEGRPRSKRWQWWVRQPASRRQEGKHTPQEVAHMYRTQCIVCAPSRKGTAVPVARESPAELATREARNRRKAGPGNLCLGAQGPSVKAVKVKSMCKQCNVFLCVPEIGARASCWEIFHDSDELDKVRV